MPTVAATSAAAENAPTHRMIAHLAKRSRFFIGRVCRGRAFTSSADLTPGAPPCLWGPVPPHRGPIQFPMAGDSSSRKPGMQRSLRILTTMVNSPLGGVSRCIWGIQCLDEPFGVAKVSQQHDAAQDSIGPGGSTALHTAHFEETAAGREAELTEARESTLGRQRTGSADWCGAGGFHPIGSDFVAVTCALPSKGASNKGSNPRLPSISHVRREFGSFGPYRGFPNARPIGQCPRSTSGSTDGLLMCCRPEPCSTPPRRREDGRTSVRRPASAGPAGV
jgi:hypothetical protein